MNNLGIDEKEAQVKWESWKKYIASHPSQEISEEDLI